MNEPIFRMIFDGWQRQRQRGDFNILVDLYWDGRFLRDGHRVAAWYQGSRKLDPAERYILCN